MATKFGNRDIRDFWNEIRPTKATKSKPPHAVDEIEGECEISEMCLHQFSHRFNCNEKLKIRYSGKLWVGGIWAIVHGGDLFFERKAWQK